MTQQEKNVEIAKMLGFNIIGDIVTCISNWVTGKGGFHYNLNFLKFHSDANWQFEAIEYVEKQGMEVSIIANECEIGTEGYKYNMIALGKGTTKKEAIFEALFQFSQYLKQENGTN